MAYPNLKMALEAAITAYDRRREGKPGYNYYGLALMLFAVDRACQRIEAGEMVGAVLADEFSDRPLTAVQNAAAKFYSAP